MEALFVNYSPLLGGAERILLDVIEGALACPEGPLARAARERGIEVLPLTQRSLEMRRSVRDRVLTPLRHASHTYELRAIVRRARPQLVVAWGMRAALALAPLGRFAFQHNDLLPSPAVAAAVRLAARRADVVIALSRAIASDLDPKGALDVQVVHPGVDLSRFAPGPGARAPLALVLSAIVPWKRPDLALEALAIAARERDDLALRIAGSPLGSAGEQLAAELRTRAARADLAGRVTFAGHTEAAAALAEATCLLHCSEREPFGLALVEALACGTPLVAPMSAGPLEIVEPSCGRLYLACSAEAAADALIDVVARAESLRAACRRRAEQDFSLEDARRRWWEAVRWSRG